MFNRDLAIDSAIKNFFKKKKKRDFFTPIVRGSEVKNVARLPRTLSRDMKYFYGNYMARIQNRYSLDRKLREQNLNNE